MIHERERARKEKKWDLADKIRDQLLSKGIVLQDDRVKPEGN